MRLDQLEAGMKARLTRTPKNLRRLEELGFVMGAWVTLIRKGLFGSPLLFRVGDTQIAIRLEEARCFEVEV